MNSNTRQAVYDVFLCHNHFDKPEVQRIKEELVNAGMEYAIGLSTIAGVDYCY